MFNDGIKKEDKKVTSFLMAGQSNMAGRGEFGEVEPINNNKCFMLRMGRWQPMSEPINPDRALLDPTWHSGVSLAASFADSFAKHFDKEVGLIPCADGGTKISQWQPGEILFDHAVMMTKLAMRTSNFGGIIWHQGEADSKYFDEEVYSKMFLNTMNGFRKELGENIPIIIGEISENISEGWGIKFAPDMNRLLHKLANSIPNCKIASSNGLELKSDGIHFVSKSAREMGRRYFEKYLEIIK